MNARQAEQLSYLELRKLVAAVSLQCQRFQRAARQFLAGSVELSGDVVWDPATQRGFLHFSGLAPNDPAVHQYQIWIFDAGRDKRYPVDGGVFDVPANAGEVVIPIRASLMVRKPAAFAVTVEKPGGVVVSGREHVVALGATS